MDREYMLIIGVGTAGALIGGLALLVGAEILGVAGIACGALAVLAGVVGAIWNAE